VEGSVPFAASGGQRSWYVRVEKQRDILLALGSRHVVCGKEPPCVVSGRIGRDGQMAVDLFHELTGGPKFGQLTVPIMTDRSAGSMLQGPRRR